ncbi:hypothetical protein FPV67DRAFT_1197657 [Lyophyllum atratum]|nr:hypothetical protein FPV67DRAFT_1197657 [Lyophyllum atratum]
MNVSELEAARGTAHLLDSSDIAVSSFGGKQARDTGYARIRREVKNLKAAIRVWNERHNSLSLSSRLPPEILSTIFEFFSEAERKELIDGVFDDFKWIRISHVCRHWRRAALACPSLWSSVLLTHPSARELLHRSGAAPLTMWFKLEDPSDFGRVRLLLKHMSRVEEVGLYFQGYAWVWEGSLTTVLREIHASPCLKTCIISFENAATGTLPGAFLSKAPQLKTLTLQRCMLPNNCPEFPSLTSLSILSTFDTFPSLRRFNHILNKFRILERLILDWDFQNTLDLFENAESPAILPYLRELRIHTTLNNCSALLRNIIFPIKASVRVSPYTFGVDSPISSFGKILRKRIAPIICLEVSNEWDSVHLRIWDQLGTYFRPPGSTRVHIRPLCDDGHSEPTFRSRGASHSFKQSLVDTALGEYSVPSHPPYSTPNMRMDGYTWKAGTAGTPAS